MNDVIRMCQFRNCDKEAGKRFFCAEHTCELCDSHDGHLVYVKKAHVIRDRTEFSIRLVCGAAIKPALLGRGNYCTNIFICKYPGCEFVRFNGPTCKNHILYECITNCGNVNTINNTKCNECILYGKYKCYDCGKLYKKTFMYRIIQCSSRFNICYACKDEKQPEYVKKAYVEGEYIKNIYDYYHAMIYTFIVFGKYIHDVNRIFKTDSFYISLSKLPFELIDKILKYANMAPSFIKVTDFINKNKIYYIAYN